MRYSRSLIPTLKEDPGEAQVVSHRFMLRSGMIRQLASGVYTWLPIGLRVLRKVENVVRREMNAAGAQEVLMPAVQPAELWQESGRWAKYGPELLRLKDRNDRAFCFGPTHEEVITDLARRELRSYRQLPANFYQIQTKFRDEIRPRFGVMRGREFLMKDAYSFDLDEAGLEQTYQAMFAAYRQIFLNCGLKFRAVEADTGAIGGAYSHEFHVLAESGEDVIAFCDHCQYAANLEKATSGPLPPLAEVPVDPMAKVSTPGRKSIAEVSEFLGVDPRRTVKAMVVESDLGAFLLLLRGDHEFNEIKSRNALGAQWLKLAEPPRAAELAGTSTGYLGPVGATLPMVADLALEGLDGFVCGANEVDFHRTGVRWERDLPRPRFADLRAVAVGDPCPRCAEGRLEQARGIEVGHVFKLGYKYSQSMGVAVQGPEGGEVTPIMGCYGIGVSRIVAAAIEQNHDANGIVWPMALAPFQVQILLMNPTDAPSAAAAETLYAELLEAGVEVLLDDRDERPGVKFKDADLLGIPLRVLVGGRSFKEGMLEVQDRRGGAAERMTPQEAAQGLMNKVRDRLRQETGAHGSTTL
ncbi:MAG: proline--tRNA ligase [Magnetococcales bacterium]|nr:proline--tRNA ligase [Magnetococcales bacterium]